MTAGEEFVASLPLKRSFYDQHERRAYLRMVEIGKRIVDNPRLLESGQSFLDQFMRSDPSQRSYYTLWRRLLTKPERDVVRQLLEDSDLGAELRESAPVFVTIAKEDLAEVWRAHS